MVAMSGGVDSSVAAALLLEQGYEVAGATIQVWNSPRCGNKNTNACCGVAGIMDARAVANKLGIPYQIFHFEDAFKREVVDRFASEYQKGRTPNPCISCNEHIKFAMFFEKARELGYDKIATGHYAQVHPHEESGRYYLSEGKDLSKDQSYVLFPLQQTILKDLLLPVGSFTKKEIRDKARDLELVVMDKPDSQEICFVPNQEYGPFLEKEFGKPKLPPGVIRHKDGRVLGDHPGYYHFTRGQRRGLQVAFSERLYVIETRPETNEVIVGSKEDILDQSFRVERVNWFLNPPADNFSAEVKIRSQHRKTRAKVIQLSATSARVEFEIPQDAITPGQAAVFYDGDRLIGGGWIEEVMESPLQKIADQSKSPLRLAPEA